MPSDMRVATVLAYDGPDAGARRSWPSVSPALRGPRTLASAEKGPIENYGRRRSAGKPGCSTLGRPEDRDGIGKVDVRRILK